MKSDDVFHHQLNPLLNSSQETININNQTTGNISNKNLNKGASSVFFHTSELNSSNINSLTNSKLIIFHQNTCGLRTKINEIICHFSKLPHIVYY
jgi:hypothetical protein